MSTSFQPASYDSWFFHSNPAAVTPLGALEPQHIRLQLLTDGSPQTSSTTWDFSTLDAIAQPVLGVGDHSPEMQIGTAPSFMYDSTGHLLDTTGQQFAAYAAQLVRYYNSGGFTASDGHHASPSSYPITWWGIYNEPNINNVSPTQYLQLYNATVPAMQAVDPSLRFVAIELAGGLYDGETYVPDFIGGVHARVDAVALHFYSTCGRSASDAVLMASVPTFASSVTGVRAALTLNPTLDSVPVWVTENNVDADYDLGNGKSACSNGASPFAIDPRGTSAFFAAWRPYVFSQLGKAGARALYHWVFAADAQYGELNATTGQRQLAYWVDYWLAHSFPSTPGATILATTNSDTADVEVLAARNADSTVSVMVVNHTVGHPSDNNGHGAQATIQLDLSPLGTFQSATALTIDATTDPAQGPQATNIAPASPMKIVLGGYGVTFVQLR
jgi:hypothetical protein